MNKLAIILASAAATGLVACSTNPPPPAAVVDPNNPLMAPGYMMMAASSDMFEIQSGQLAQQMSQNPAIRSFGQMLVTDHSRTTQMIMAAAQSAGLAAPAPMLRPDQQAMLDQLRSSGPNFDQLFKSQQIMAHQQALALHSNYAASGDVPALRAVAAQAAPIIQQHLNMLQSLQVMAPPPPPPPPPPPVRAGERG